MNKIITYLKDKNQKFSIRPDKSGRLVVSFSIIIMLLISCSDPLGIEDNLRITYKRANNLVPLEVGNEWTYKITYYDSTGLETAIKKITINVSEEIINNNNSWFVTDDSLKILTDALLSNRDDGLWVMADDTIKQEYIAFKYPAKLGDETIINYINKDYGFPVYIIRKILATNEKIEAQAGSYECVKYWDILYKMNGEVMYNPFAVYYFSPKVGLIRSVHYEITNLGTIYSFKKVELVEAKLN
jgi:hypothetical protein